jgi:predicted nucleotidyltransferase
MELLMNNKDLAEKNLIYKVRCGSHAYGTNLPTSDEDFAGIFIPPLEYYFGLQAFDLLSEQSEDDKSYYSLRKYANLAVANNPNVLELLFVDDQDVLLSTPAGDELRKNKKLFLSQRCQKTFVGYAKAQLHRIRTHTKWLEQEISDMEKLWPFVMNEQVTREWVAWRFGENMVIRIAQEFEREEKFTQQVLGHTGDLVRAAKNHFYHSTESVSNPTIMEVFKSSFIICPSKEDVRFFKETSFKRTGSLSSESIWEFQKHIYDEAKMKRDQYVTSMAERNPIRHETEIKFGYDTKHAMHLVRLLRAGYEILTTGDLHVKRSDAAELLDIRAGKWTYEQVVGYADEMVAKIDGLPQGSINVPDHPDVAKIDTLVVQITQEHLWKIKP